MIRSSSCSGFSALEGGSRCKATSFRIGRFINLRISALPPASYMKYYNSQYRQEANQPGSYCHQYFEHPLQLVMNQLLSDFQLAAFYFFLGWMFFKRLLRASLSSKTQH